MIQTMQVKQDAAPESAPMEQRAVIFFCHAPKAKEVSLVGTFNSWDVDATPMRRNSKGEWCVNLELPPGEYEFNAIVDGRWCSERAYAIPHGKLRPGISNILCEA